MSLIVITACFLPGNKSSSSIWPPFELAYCTELPSWLEGQVEGNNCVRRGVTFTEGGVCCWLCLEEAWLFGIRNSVVRVTSLLFGGLTSDEDTSPSLGPRQKF